MATVLYSELNVDGQVGDIYDKAAIHEEQLGDAVSQALNLPAVKQLLLDMYYPVGSLKFGGVDPSTYMGGTWQLQTDIMVIGAGNKYATGDEGGSPDAVVPSHNHTGSGNAIASGVHSHIVSGSTTTDGSHVHGTAAANYFFTVNYDLSSDPVAVQRKVASGSAYYAMTSKTNAEYISQHGTTGWAGGHNHSISGTAADAGSHTHSVSIAINSYGVDGTNKNLPPYKAFNIWLRTA